MAFATNARMIRSASVRNGLIMQVFDGKEGIGSQWIGKGIQALIFHDEVKIAQCRPENLKGTLLQGGIARRYDGNTLRSSLRAREDWRKDNGLSVRGTLYLIVTNLVPGDNFPALSPAIRQAVANATIRFFGDNDTLHDGNKSGGSVHFLRLYILRR